MPNVLIGDHKQERFEWLERILEEVYAIRVTRAVTVDELLSKAKKQLWKLIFVADDLPWSHNDSLPAPDRAFWEISTAAKSGSRSQIDTVCIYSVSPPKLDNIKPRPCFVHVGRLDDYYHGQVITQLNTLGNLLPPAPPLPLINLGEDSPMLRNQIRSLSRQRDLEDGKQILARLVRNSLDCNQIETVEVDLLGQGKSGASVFRIRLGVEREYVLKLTDEKDFWKIASEISGRKEAKDVTGVANVSEHIPELIPPCFPDDPDDQELKFAVSSQSWYAICYEFLGGKRFGRFIDLETALTASPEKLRQRMQGPQVKYVLLSPGDSAAQKPHIRQFNSLDEARQGILETMLEWLCENWYSNASLVQRRSVHMWKTADALDHKYDTLPPYQLTARTKSWVLSFLDSRDAELGARFFPTVWEGYRNQVVKLVTLPAGGEIELGTLGHKLEAILSPVHGDLNANNILLWLEKPYHPFLIDFPFFQREGHALQDLARLEVEIKFALLDRQEESPEEELKAFDHTYSQLSLWKCLEDHLHGAYWRGENVDWPKDGYEKNVKMCLEMVQMVRRYAEKVQQQEGGGTTNDDFFEEYFPALLFHTIRAISYESLSVFKRLLAVYSAGKLLERYPKGKNPI